MLDESTPLGRILKIFSEKNGSDLYISVGAPIVIKIDGQAVPITPEKVSSQAIIAIAKNFLSDDELYEFHHSKELNTAISMPGVGRFRVNGFFQRNEIGFVIRAIKTVVPSFQELGLPEVLRTLSMTPRGLLLFVGATGSGKSTSLAAMIDYRNTNSAGHILTIEDPVEFLHTNKKSIVNQREVGVDTISYENALVNALREAPDVILIGEIRSRETMEHALAYAETGHLCLSTLHANNANQAIERIINFFPDDRKKQLLMDLSLNLKAVISQRLLPKKSGKGRAAAIEVLVNTPLVADLIYKGNIGEIKEAMKKPNEVGMRSFDQHLLELFMEDQISLDQALRAADSQNDLRLAIKMACMEKGVPDPTASSEEGKKMKWTIQE